MRSTTTITTTGTTGKITYSVDYSGGAWPARPAGGSDIKVIWWGPDTAGYPTGYVAGDGLMKYTVV